jgi:predicted DNA-binding protein
MSPSDPTAMGRDEFIAWFDNTDEPDLTPMIRSMQPSSDPVAPGPVPMELSSIRLPVDLVRQLDEYAREQGKNRSTVIRDALAAFIAEQRSPVERDRVVQALEVLRRAVDTHYPNAA